MKKYVNPVLSAFLSLIFLIGFSFGYDQQGFLQYKEQSDGISFSCQSQCIILLGQKDKIDYLNISGIVNGNGIIGYGFLIGDQVSLLNHHDVVISSKIGEYMNFVEHKKYFSVVPGDTNLILLINGNVNGNIIVSVDKFSVGEKIKQGWSSFWSFDSFKPYTINLLYGPMVNGENVNKGFYVLFVIFCVILLFIRKSKGFKIKALLIGLLILRFIYDVRMGLEGINYYHEDYKNYISQGRYEKIYRDRGDFYSFVDFVKNQLESEGVKKFEEIGFFTDNTRPFPGSMKYFLYPYRIRDNQDVGKYILVYQSSKVKIIDNNNIEIDNNKITGKMTKFQDYAFIFVKDK